MQHVSRAKPELDPVQRGWIGRDGFHMWLREKGKLHVKLLTAAW